MFGYSWHELIPYLVSVILTAVAVLSLLLWQLWILRRWKRFLLRITRSITRDQMEIKSNLHKLRYEVRRLGTMYTNERNRQMDSSCQSAGVLQTGQAPFESLLFEPVESQPEKTLEDRIEVVTGEDKVSLKRTLHSDFFYLEKEQGCYRLKVKDQMLGRTPQPQYDTVIKRYFEFVDHGTKKYEMHKPAEATWDERTQSGKVVQRGEIWV